MPRPPYLGANRGGRCTVCPSLSRTASTIRAFLPHAAQSSFEDYRPDDDATVVKRLLGAGGIFIGKTNMPEFALWWETGNLVHGFTENPWMIGRTAGGSSGGEASAIASGMSPLGIGSDVGGSIRWPAHVAGIVGIKPTHGLVPLTGHFPETLLRFMHVGPMARTVRDVGFALSIIAGPDDADPYALPIPMPDLCSLDGELPKLKVGFCAEGPFAPVMADIQQVVKRAANTLEVMGCDVEEIDLAGWHDRQAQDISMSYFLGEGAFDLDPIIEGRVDELASFYATPARPAPSVSRGLLSQPPGHRVAPAGCEAVIRVVRPLAPPDLAYDRFRARFAFHKHRRPECAWQELTAHYRAV